MKIGIDTSLTIGQKAGVGNYTYNLIKYLAKIDKKNKYLLFPFYYHIFHPSFKNAYCPKQNNFRINQDWIPEKIIKKAWYSGKIAKKWFFPKVDILHSTTFCVPKTGYKKLIVTIYDLSFITHPQYHIKENIKHCKEGTLKAVKKADKIIAISNHTKKDLIKYMNCNPEKIEVIYLGVDSKFKIIKNNSQISKKLKKYNINKKYIFNLGSIEPRKNIIGLIKAYSLLPQEIIKKYDLIIGGGKGWKNSAIYKKIKELKLEKHIKFIGFVKDNDLPYLYNGAEIFVYPSFYEGFGLPILEAMACGCPVISSNNSSIPEVVGDAGILINPKKTIHISNTIKDLLNNKKTKTLLIKKMQKQVNNFSLEKTALKTKLLYDNVI